VRLVGEPEARIFREMGDKVEPSARGKEFFPHHEGFWWDYDFEEFVPCTCKPECSIDCKGTCGCEAHRREYSSVMSARGCS